MGKRFLIARWSVLAFFFIGLFGITYANDQSDYDWMGTPIISSNQITTRVPNYLNPYYVQRPEWDPYGPGATPQLARPQWDPFAPGFGAFNLQLEPDDPAREGLAVSGDSRFANQLYLQKGSQLLTQGIADLGEEYVLWVRVSTRGRFILQDSSRQILNQADVTPGWYRIKGAYADFLGHHIYRFVSGVGPASNNLSIFVDPGRYPTSLSLTGKVVDRNGFGMPAVNVIVSNNEGGKFTTVTGPGGYYALDLASGIYLVNAEFPGYIFTQSAVQVTSGFVSAAKPIWALLQIVHNEYP